MRVWTLTAFLSLLAGPLWAAAAKGPHSAVELVAASRTLRPGTTLEAALRFTMEPGWHIYWMNPGDSGTPPELEWKLPPGYEGGALEWPAPQRLEQAPLVNYGYEKEVLLPVRIQVPGDAALGPVSLKASVGWLICERECLPAEGETTLTLPVADRSPEPDPRWVEAVTQARKRLPAPLGWAASAEAKGRTLELKLKAPAGYDGAFWYFFPKEKLLLDHAAAQPVARAEDGTRTLALPLAEQTGKLPARLEGLLSWDGAAEAEAGAAWVSLPLLGAAPAPAASLAWLLVLAFAGGLLLNLMPCVFPVLAVKVLGFVEDHGSGSGLSRSLAYGAGVLASFWALAGLLLALRAGGAGLGWGFQLQSPPFVALMACLFVLIGLNLFGVFEIGASLTRLGGLARGGGLASSFGSGALAVLIATPCTAPFMGAALGAALALPTASAFAIFTALGAGMAAPYVALAAHPSWLKGLPRSGAWLESLKQALAFPLLGTAVWLSWVYALQTGPDAALRLWWAFLLLGVSAWSYGRWGQGPDPRPARLISRLAAALALACAVGLCLAVSRPAASTLPSKAAAEGGIAWEPWSAERVEALLREGRPIFVDFTAAWCVTCQVNERLVLAGSDVQKRFQELGVAALKADWTSRDPAITAALAAQGRSGVPMYLVYKAGASRPSVLPTLLTPGLVLAELEAKAKGP